MADTWQCWRCDTVNDEDQERCIACDTPKYPAPRVEPPTGATPPPSGPPWAAPRGPVSPEPEDDEPPPAPERLEWGRPVATGKFLGIGHAALVMTALVFALSEIGLGQAILRLVYFPGIAPISTWEGGPIIHQAFLLLNLLPWAGAKWFYLLLCVACLVMRFTRMPGPVSLVIAIPAALYGVLVAISELPVFIDCWPLTLLALAVSWFIVAKTLPEAGPAWSRDWLGSFRLVRR